jgi:predicted nucleotidyltransferase component of viral defense system
MDKELINKIKKISIIALASDDQLVEDLVLKGGNAIDLAFKDVLGNVSRTSYDLDYSISGGDFKEIDLIEKRILETLNQTFKEHGYIVLDYKFLIKPKQVNEATHDFWGGYKVTFKLIEEGVFESLKGDIEKVRRNTISVNPNNSPKFELEFSKYEHVEGNKEYDYEGFKIRVYTPEMIVFEKLRALCQQLPEYEEIVPGFNPRARARDFYDIYLLIENFEINPETEENLQLISDIFSAKKVPLEFIAALRHNKEIHAENWIDVKSTVTASTDLEDFDYYFESTLSQFEKLKFR